MNSIDRLYRSEVNKSFGFWCAGLTNIQWKPQSLHHPERKRPEACLFDLPSMGVGVESVVPDSDLAFPYIEGEVFQGQKRPDHVFSDPLGIFLCLGPEQ